jgi:hypothetical protein
LRVEQHFIIEQGQWPMKRHQQNVPGQLGGRSGANGLVPLSWAISSVVERVKRNNGRRLNVVAAGGLVAGLLAIDLLAKI